MSVRRFVRTGMHGFAELTKASLGALMVSLLERTVCSRDSCGSFPDLQPFIQQSGTNETFGHFGVRINARIPELTKASLGAFIMMEINNVTT